MSGANYGGINQPPYGAYPGAYPSAPPAGNMASYPPQPSGGGAGGAPPPQGPTLWKGEMPNDDVHDDPNRQAPAPSAPPISMMERLPGYEDVGYQNGGFSPPPTYNDAMQMPTTRPEVTNIPRISEDAAAEALIQFVSEHCCYGKKAAEKSRILEMIHSSAFHYTLETFTETRGTAWAFQPYSGQTVDGPFNGPAPGPWEIPASPTQKFTNAVIKSEVPHSAFVKPCHDCFAMGFKRCWRCMGRGRVVCDSCHGSGRREVLSAEGHRHHEHCTWCHGSGRKRCYTCNGDGRVVCGVCAGRAQLKWFIELTIKWDNHVLDHVVERTALPDELIRNVSGKLAFEEEGPRVFPINHFPDDAVNSASQELVRKHSNGFPQSRVLLQRQRVRIVPVCQCQAQFKDKPYQFFVYGFENRVHSPEYPQKCCCGCVML